MTLRTLDILARRSVAVLTLLCVAGSATSSLWNHPHSLAYFNEAAGGPANGHKYMLGSNLDLGQDLYFLRAWLHNNPGVPVSSSVLECPYPLQAIPGFERLASTGRSSESNAVSIINVNSQMRADDLSLPATRKIEGRCGWSILIYPAP